MSKPSLPRGRPRMSSQDLARGILRNALQDSRISLNQLSHKIGLKGHASLSRFFSGKQRLSLETLLRICKELGVEGKTYEALVSSIIPAELLLSSKQAADPAATKRGRKQASRSSHSKPNLMRFFFHMNMPIV